MPADISIRKISNVVQVPQADSSASIAGDQESLNHRININGPNRVHELDYLLRKTKAYIGYVDASEGARVQGQEFKAIRWANKRLTMLLVAVPRDSSYERVCALAQARVAKASCVGDSRPVRRARIASIIAMRTGSAD